MKYVPQPCAEFPNDNPELHDGAVWACAWTRAHPRAVLRASGAARLALPSDATVPERVGAAPATLHADGILGVPPVPFSVVLPPARVWITLRPWSVEEEPLDLSGVWPETPAPTAHAPVDDLLAGTLIARAEHAFEPAMELAPIAEDPFVDDLWLELETIAGRETPRPWATRDTDELSPAPMSELRLSQPGRTEAEEPWNRLEPLELDLSPLPPKAGEWAHVLTQLSRMLLDYGAIRSAALIAPLLEAERVNLRALSIPARTQLLAIGFAEAALDDVWPTSVFRREATAFREWVTTPNEGGEGAIDWLAQVVFALSGALTSLAEVRAELVRLELLPRLPIALRAAI